MENANETNATQTLVEEYNATKALVETHYAELLVEEPDRTYELREKMRDTVHRFMRQHMQDKMARLAMHPMAHKSYDIRGRRQHKRNGHEIAMMLSKYRDLMDRSITSLGEAISLETLTDHVWTYTTTDNTRKILPNFVESRRRLFSSDDSIRDWEYIDLRKLMPEGNFRYEFGKAVEATRLVHMIHRSEENPTQIAYFPTMKHMRDNRVVRTKLGKYLTNFANVFGLSEAEIKDMVERWNARNMADANWQVRFVESNDPQGWVKVYASQEVQSCMRGESAVSVYAHDKSVLRLAYLARVHPKTDEVMDIIARCIVRDDDEKGWLRVYPDPNGHSEGKFLLDYLNENGYPNRTSLDGVLLTADYDGEAEAFVCPYIDAGNGCSQSVDVVRVDGVEYLRVSENGEHNATNTNGYTEESGCSCASCGDRYHEDDLIWVECESESICRHCYDDQYVYGYVSSTYKDDIPVDDAVCIDGTYYHVDCLADHDIHYCEVTEDYYYIDNLCYTKVGYVHVNCCTHLDYEDSEGHDYAVTDDTKELPDGKVCHEDDYEAIMAEHYSEDDDGQADKMSECL